MALRGSHRLRALGVPGPGRLSAGDVTELLFVYGTLRAGRAPAPLRWLEELAREAATAPGRLIDLGAYPGALAAEGEGARIVGELVAVPGHRLPELDRYEGFQPDDPVRSLFRREETRALAGDGRRRRCWIYRFAGPADAGSEIPEGDWLARRRD